MRGMEWRGWKINRFDNAKIFQSAYFWISTTIIKTEFVPIENGFSMYSCSFFLTSFGCCCVLLCAFVCANLAFVHKQTLIHFDIVCFFLFFFVQHTLKKVFFFWKLSKTTIYTEHSALFGTGHTVNTGTHSQTHTESKRTQKLPSHAWI